MSGYIDKFWIHDTDPNAMFMHLDMGNAHGTFDGGERWETIRDSDGTGKDIDGLTGFAFSHQDPDFGMMLAKEGIYSTNDRGRSWQFMQAVPSISSQKHSVIVVDPSDDDVWYIGAGQHWMIKFTHFNKDGLVYSADRNHSEGFILKTTDKGQTWSVITSVFPPDTDFSNVIVDPSDSNKVYASCQYGVYRSVNAGVTWAKVEGVGLPHNQPRDMASYYNPSTGEFLLYIVEVTRYTPSGSSIATTGGVYRSANGGATWSNLTGNLAIDLNQITSWGYIDKYWTAVAYWLGITKAQAQSLYPNLPSSTFSQFTGLEVDPNNKNRIYLVHNFKHDYSFPPGNIWMTEDGGASWIAAAREGPYWANEVDKAYWQSRGNPLGVNTQFAHVQKEHSDSDNTQTGPRFVEVNSIGEVYTAFAQQVMRSTDHGATWTQVDDFETYPGSGNWVGRGDSNLPGETLCVDTGVPGSYLFGSGEHGLWRNTNDGDLVYPGAIAVRQLAGQSTSSSDALSIGSIAVHPNDPSRIYTLQFRQTQRGNLRYSPDSGATWQTLSSPIAFPAANDVIKQHSLLIDPSNPSYLYFCVPVSDIAHFTSSQWIANGPSGFSAYGVYKSADGGASWTLANNGIPSGKSVYRLAMDPNNPQTLYAALNQTHTLAAGGLYKSVNRGGSWSAMTLPTSVASVNQVVVQKTTGDIYIATGTYSNDGSVGGAWVSRNGGAAWELLFDMPNVRGVAPSPVDPDVIAVNVGMARSISLLNPGAYVTLDGGQGWHKINQNHGQPDRINEIRADPYDADVLWCSLHGTGFFKADLVLLANQAVFHQFATVQDADVKATAPTSNYGSNSNLKLEPAGPRHAYAQFNVAGVTGSIADAKLWIRNHASTPLVGQLTARAAVNGWSESAVTWNLKNDLGAALGSRALSSPGDWYSVDVTSHITGNGVYTIGLESSSLGYLYAKEFGDGSSAPYLEIVAYTSHALPSPWQNQDIGGVAAAGEASHGGGSYALKGSGADIWGALDEFQFVYQAASGDCSVVARVASVENTHTWAKAGVMIRETLGAGSKNAMVAVTPGQGVSFQSRLATSGVSTNTKVAGIAAPHWVRVDRVGGSVIGYHSADGVNWTQISSQSLSMASDVYIGLAVTSHNDGVVCEAVFDQVSANP